VIEYLGEKKNKQQLIALQKNLTAATSNFLYIHNRKKVPESPIDIFDITDAHEGKQILGMLFLPAAISTPKLQNDPELSERITSSKETGIPPAPKVIVSKK